jgi:hypothetical protein
MPDIPSVFSVGKIALTATIAFVGALVALLILLRRRSVFSVREVVMLAALVGFSVFAWRMAGNVAQLNDDPIPPISPNDLLCPTVTYVVLGLYAAFRRPANVPEWEKTRAWLTVISFVVNVVFI